MKKYVLLTGLYNILITPRLLLVKCRSGRRAVSSADHEFTGLTVLSNDRAFEPLLGQWHSYQSQMTITDSRVRVFPGVRALLTRLYGL